MLSTWSHFLPGRCEKHSIRYDFARMGASAVKLE